MTAGDAKATILAQLQAGDHDLLVIGSRRRGTVRATLLGSLGYALLVRSSVPVLIARHPAPA
jgi:nucleotide-binding universal stress UspA family protein